MTTVKDIFEPPCGFDSTTTTQDHDPLLTSYACLVNVLIGLIAPYCVNIGHENMVNTPEQRFPTLVFSHPLSCMF